MLKGLKVLDFSRYLPGPYASLRLAEWGADVIKVETGPYGDPARKMEPFIKETGAIYLASNVGKRSMLVDLKTEEGLHTIHQLLKKVDVVIESYRPGVADQIGFGYQQARELNPKIVYCSLSGYGQEGKMKDLGGHDINYLAVSGILDGIVGETNRPGVPDVTVADLAGGMAAAEAILAAYIQCLKTGEGSFLDISLVDTMYSWQGVNAMMSSTSKGETSLGEELRKVISYQIYETKDGRFMALGALEEKFWVNFCKAAGRNDLIPYHRTPAIPENPFYEEIKKLFGSFDFSYWCGLAEKVDACLTPVFTRAEAFNNPLANDRGFLGTAELNEEKIKVVKAIPTKNAANISYIPQLGEHSEDVLGGLEINQRN